MVESIEDILDSVEFEVKRAMELHSPMTTCHDGYAIILEELEELWAEIKIKQSKRNTIKLRDEATQVAAMAVRFLHDLDGTK